MVTNILLNAVVTRTCPDPSARQPLDSAERRTVSTCASPRRPRCRTGDRASCAAGPWPADACCARGRGGSQVKGGRRPSRQRCGAPLTWEGRSRKQRDPQPCTGACCRWRDALPACLRLSTHRSSEAAQTTVNPQHPKAQSLRSVLVRDPQKAEEDQKNHLGRETEPAKPDGTATGGLGRRLRFIEPPFPARSDPSTQQCRRDDLDQR
jgi:hypothetical protein